MVKETKTGERLMRLETKVDNIEIHLQEQSNTLGKIEAKFDTVMNCKADKEEVNLLRDKVNKVVYGALISLISVLIGIVAFLLKEQLFR